jgi:hypothetical protein
MRHPVPRITQYASPSLIGAITYGGHPRAEDPRWRESSAPDQETYAAWCARWCGMASFRDKHGLQADVITDLDAARLMAELDAGRLIIASVHPEIARIRPLRRPPRHRPPPVTG